MNEFVFAKREAGTVNVAWEVSPFGDVVARITPSQPEGASVHATLDIGFRTADGEGSAWEFLAEDSTSFSRAIRFDPSQYRVELERFGEQAAYRIRVVKNGWLINESVSPATENYPKKSVEMSVVGATSLGGTRSDFALRNPNETSINIIVLRRYEHTQEWAQLLAFTMPADTTLHVVDEQRLAVGTEYATVQVHDGLMQVVSTHGSYASIWGAASGRGRPHKVKGAPLRYGVREARVAGRQRDSIRTPPEPIVLQESGGARVVLGGLSPNIVSSQLFKSGRLIDEATVSEQADGVIEMWDAEAIPSGLRIPYRVVLFDDAGRRAEVDCRARGFARVTEVPVMTELNVVRGNLGSSVELGVRCELLASGVESFVSVLADTAPEFIQGYGSDVELLRSQIRDLVWFRMGRFNLSTGETAQLGTFRGSSGEVMPFIDDEPTSLERGVEPPVVGTSYIYILTPVVRSPITLLERADTKTAGENGAALRFRQFFHPLSQVWNTIPSDSRMVDRPQTRTSYSLAPKDELELGKVAAQRWAYVQGIPEPQPTTRSVKHNTDEQGRLVVDWSFTTAPKNGFRLELEGVDANGNTLLWSRRQWAQSAVGQTMVFSPPFSPQEIRCIPL